MADQPQNAEPQPPAYFKEFAQQLAQHQHHTAQQIQQIGGAVQQLAQHQAQSARPAAPRPNPENVREQLLTTIVNEPDRFAAEVVGFATVFALLLRAGLASLDGPGGQAAAADALAQAGALATTHDMALHAAAAQALLSTLREDATGAAARTAAAAYVAQHRIAEPDRFFALVASLAARPPAAAGG